MDQISPNNVSVTPPQNLDNRNWFQKHRMPSIVFGCAVLLFLAASVVFWRSYEDVSVNCSSQNSEKCISAGSSSESTSNTKDVQLNTFSNAVDTSHWPSYINDSLGFTLRYPIDQLSKDYKNIGDNNSLEVAIVIQKDQNTYDGLFITGMSDTEPAKSVAQEIWKINKNDDNPNVHKTVSELKEINFGGVQAYSFNLTGSYKDEYEEESLEPGVHTYVYFQNGTRVGVVRYQQDSQIMKAVASTIRIIPRPNTSWSVFMHNDLGFTLSYPSTYKLQQDSPNILISNYGKIEILDQGLSGGVTSELFFADSLKGNIQYLKDQRIKIVFPNDRATSKFVSFIFSGGKSDSAKVEEFRQIASSVQYLISDNPATWQTYTNDGISFSYPSNLFQTIEKGQYVFASAQGFRGSMYISLNDSPFDLKNIKGVYDTYNGKNQKQYRVGDRIGYEVIEGDAGCVGKAISTNFKNKTLTINFSECEHENVNFQSSSLYSDENLIKAILLSFKFKE